MRPTELLTCLRPPPCPCIGNKTGNQTVGLQRKHTGPNDTAHLTIVLNTPPTAPNVTGWAALLIRRSSVRNRRGPPLYLQVSALRSPAHSSGPVNGVARNHEVFSPQESRAVPPRTAQARPSAESVQHPRRAPPGCRETLGERWWRARRESSGPACPRQPRWGSR